MMTTTMMMIMTTMKTTTTTTMMMMMMIMPGNSFNLNVHSPGCERFHIRSNGSRKFDFEK